MAYEFVEIPVEGSRSTTCAVVWHDGEPIGTVKYDKTHIFALMIIKRWQRRGHGRAIALHLLDGRQPVCVLPEAAGFWRKVQAEHLMARAAAVRSEAIDSIGHKAIRLHDEAKRLEQEATMRRWV